MLLASVLCKVVVRESDFQEFQTSSTWETSTSEKRDNLILEIGIFPEHKGRNTKESDLYLNFLDLGSLCAQEIKVSCLKYAQSIP